MRITLAVRKKSPNPDRQLKLKPIIKYYVLRNV